MEELVTALRGCVLSKPCDGCPYYDPNGPTEKCATMNIAAADAIEELQADKAALNGTVTNLLEQIKCLGKPKWIPVTERLPENDQDVLVMVHWRDYPENMMCYGRKYKTRWYLWNGELGELIKGFDITHWMPLPEPPKEE